MPLIGISLKPLATILEDYTLRDALTEAHKSQQVIDAVSDVNVSTILFSLADMLNNSDYHGSSLDEIELMQITAKLQRMAIRAGRKEGAL